MRLQISSAYIADALQELNNQVKLLGPSVLQDSKIIIPPQFGNGEISSNFLKNGLDIVAVHSLQLLQNAEILIKSNVEQAVYELTFFSDGNASWQIQGTKTNLISNVSKGAVLVSPTIDETIKFSAHQRYSFTTMLLKPLFLNNYLRDVHETPSEVFSELVAQPDSEFHFELPYLSADMQVALYQMNNNIYQGILRELYIESKSMELIAHFFAQIKRTFTPVKKLRRNELDLVYEASNILQDNLENPPSVLELSRIIGLNEYKLRLGFKILFNSTVYEYLRKQRMNKARLLLEMKEITIAEAGYAVGYSNLSHFAAAFKKEFGINPSQYIANK